MSGRRARRRPGGAHNGAKTHCVRGHDLTRARLYIDRSGYAHRICVACRRDYYRAGPRSAEPVPLGYDTGDGIKVNQRAAQPRECMEDNA